MENILDHGAVLDGTTDCLAALNAAKATGTRAIYVPGPCAVSAPFVMDVEGLRLFGDGRFESKLLQTTNFSGVATVDVNGGRLQQIDNMFVGANKANGSDAIRVTSGQLFTLQHVVAKWGVSGVRLISGNSQRWHDVFAESNDYGFVVSPETDNNTNGCHMTGLRAYNSAQWGVDIACKSGSVVEGHMHSTWDVSTEGGVNGIRVRGGRYNHMNLYSEGNSGQNFDLDKGPANYYFVKNPNNTGTGALFTNSHAMGIVGTAGELYLDNGWRCRRIRTKDFPYSMALDETGVDMWVVTNSSGGTRSFTLSYLDYAPVGHVCEIIKSDATPGFIPYGTATVSLSGDTGTFAAYPSGAMRMTVIKTGVNSAVCHVA